MLAKQTTSGALQLRGRKSLVEVAPKSRLWIRTSAVDRARSSCRQVYNQYVVASSTPSIVPDRVDLAIKGWHRHYQENYVRDRQ
jgi:hypothetical protein